MTQQTTVIVDLVMYTGCDFAQTFVLEDNLSSTLKNTTGYTACAQMRRFETASAAATFNVDFSSDRAQGKLELSLTSTTTQTLKPGKYFYDVILKDDSNIKERIVEGTVTVKKAVTRLY